MMNLNINEYLGTNYTNGQIEMLTMCIRLLAICGASGAPQTKEELKAWCDETIEEDNKIKEKKAKAKAKRLAKKNNKKA